MQNVYHRYVHAFSCKTVKNKNLRYSFKATADAVVKSKIYSICSMTEL